MWKNSTGMLHPDNTNLTFRNMAVDYRTQMLIWSSIGLPVLCFGTLGNCLTLAVIVRSRWWQTGLQVLIASLTIAELLETLIVHPHAMFNMIYGAVFPWNIRSFCRFAGYITMISYYLVPVHCCMIALNRFVTIVLYACPRLQAITSKRAGLVMASCCWILPIILFSLPLAEVDGFFKNGKPFGQCTWAGYLGSRALSYLVSGSMIYAPSVVIFLCYFAIFIYLKQADRSIHSFTGSLQRSDATKTGILPRDLLRKRRRVKVAKMMMVTFLVYITCYLPLNSFFYLARDVNKSPNPIIFMWFLLIYWLTACFNTIIYASMNRDYRVGYMETIRQIRGVLCSNRGRQSAPRKIMPADSQTATEAKTVTGIQHLPPLRHLSFRARRRSIRSLYAAFANTSYAESNH